MSERYQWLLLGAGLLFACSSATTDNGGGAGASGSAVSHAGSAGASGSAPSNGGATSGGSSVAGATSAGSANGGSSSPYDGLSVKPDTDTTPVASCTGQPDMKLCKVVTSPDRDYDICVGGTCVSPGCGDTSCNASAPHFLTPPNSNHKYMQLQTGAEPVTIDLVTGLHWQSCMAGDLGEKCTTTGKLSLTWNEAIQYCEDSTWAGKTDWYLPDAWELLSLLDWTANEGKGPGVDMTFFPDGGSFLWTNALQRADDAIAIQFVSGAPVALPTIVDDGTSDKHWLRCVRRGFSRDAGFTDARFSFSPTATEKVIEDRATGLLWQGCSSGASGRDCQDGGTMKVPLADFVSYCDNLSWGGSSDWRLPTYKELHSIVAYPPLGGTEPSIPDSVFDVSYSAYLGARTGLDANAKPILIQVEGGEQVGPTGSYPVMCTRWK